MKNTILIVSLCLLAACKKDINSCKPKELSGQAQLININDFGAPELLDTLAKYPQLQVFQARRDGNGWYANCNVFYQGLIIFTGSYNLFKSSTGQLSRSGDTIPDKTINISLHPSVSYADAIEAAKSAVNLDHLCVSYRLGLFRTGYGTTPETYRLVWKIQEAEHAYPFVIVDAANKTILETSGGIIYE